MTTALSLIATVISLSTPGYPCSSPSGVHSSSEENHSHQKHSVWIHKTVKIFRNVSCTSVDFALQDQCETAKKLRDLDINVYTAEASKSGKKIFASLPDRSFEHSGEHDGIVVVDPFPEGSYGHLVFVYFVDQEDRGSCEGSAGIYSEFLKSCFRRVQRSGCYRNPHLIRRRMSQKKTRSCDVSFLPAVFDASNSIGAQFTNGPQLLQCRNLPEFAPCPTLRQRNITDTVYCKSPTCRHYLDKRLVPRCRQFEMCDHAVVIQGGWSRLVSRAEDFRILMETERFFVRNRFPMENIKLFYANGNPDFPSKRTTIFIKLLGFLVQNNNLMIYLLQTNPDRNVCNK